MANQDQHNVAIQVDNNECCIYKVPPKLRRLNRDAYTPSIVSIGPFHHHGNTDLEKMEDLKITYCQKFIDERSEMRLDDLFEQIKEMEPRVRRCYSKDIGLTREKFAVVISVDCCFILEFMLGENSIKNDTSTSTSLIRPPPPSSASLPKEDMLWDLLLLENQIPFFVFEEIYTLALPFPTRRNGTQHQSFWNLACKWCSYQIQGKIVEPTNDIDSIAHFTDLYRYYYLLQLSNNRKLPKRAQKSLDYPQNVTELKEAGVKFMENKESKFFLDIKFQKPYLKIPKFIVNDRTEMILRNMVVFEQFRYPKQSYFIDYIELLDCLINTDKDVDELVKNGIIVNMLGDRSAVAQMFNGLHKNVERRKSNSNYLRVCKSLNDYYRHPRHRRMATLRRDYCNNPWMALASTAAFILLILTVVQTICSILQVV